MSFKGGLERTSFDGVEYQDFYGNWYSIGYECSPSAIMENIYREMREMKVRDGTKARMDALYARDEKQLQAELDKR